MLKAGTKLPESEAQATEERATDSGVWSWPELLLGFFILLLLGASTLPTVALGFHRNLQRRTMDDMRRIAMAVEAYTVDNNIYPASGYTVIATAAASKISTQVVPTYIQALPEKDGWGTTFYYSNTNQSQVYQVRSLGANSADDSGDNGPTTNFNSDIVFENGRFVVYPEGVPK